MCRLIAVCMALTMSLPVTAHAAKPTAVFRGDAQDFRENVQLSVQSAKTKLKLNKSAATILVGEKITLKATVTGKKGTVKWSSSKKSVVTVRSKGVATGKKKETATITAKVNGVRNCAPSCLLQTPDQNPLCGRIAREVMGRGRGKSLNSVSAYVICHMRQNMVPRRTPVSQALQQKIVAGRRRTL